MGTGKSVMFILYFLSFLYCERHGIKALKSKVPYTGFSEKFLSHEIKNTEQFNHEISFMWHLLAIPFFIASLFQTFEGMLPQMVSMVSFWILAGGALCWLPVKYNKIKSKYIIKSIFAKR